MESCATCNTTILFGGVKEDDERFCNARCRSHGHLARAARRLPVDEVARAVDERRNGPCPVCSGPGPVAAHTSHKVTSAFVVTQWASAVRLSCRACARRAQWTSILHSMFLGPWGIPWGLVMTPVQVVRNVLGLTRPEDHPAGLEQLETLVRLDLAAQQSQAGPLPAAGALKRAA